jgi:hypothetical protein
VETVFPQFRKAGLDSEKLLQKLSYSHFERLAQIEADLKRSFYELECMKGKWSVWELKSQINSLTINAPI